MSDFNKDDLNSLVTELRSTIESKTAHLGETKEKIEKLEAKLDQYEEANQKLVQEIGEKAKKELELEEKYKDLERHVYTLPNALSKNEKSAEMKKFEDFVISGKIHDQPQEQKYLRTDVDVDGGYLAPVEYVKEIIKKITEISPIRSVARVRTAAGKASEMPIRDTLVTSNWVGEGEEDTSSHSTYGLEYMPIHKLQVTVPITLEELQDSAFDMQVEINADVVEEFAKREGAAFVNGNSVKKPEGFMYAADVPSINSGVAADLTMDSLITMTGELKTGYTPMYGFNRKTRARIMRLKDGVGQYLWQAGNVAAGIPNTLNGYPYLEIIDIDNIGANTFPVVFADFMRGYLIGDRMAMNVIRDDFTRKRYTIIEFTFTKRVGAQVILPEAFIKLKCSV